MARLSRYSPRTDQPVFPDCAGRRGCHGKSPERGHHYIPTKPDSIPEQLSQIEDVVVKMPSAIIFIPVDYKAMVPGVEKINAAKIPIVNITDRSAGGKFVSFVGADDYSLGLETARHLLKTLGGKGNIVIIEGVKGSLTNIDRVRGFNDALKDNSGAKLLASQPGNYQRL
jgi:ribose transport system substrate-binding protein